MAERVPFLLRLDPEVMAALRKWANDDIRSLNAEVEFLLRRSLREAGRLPAGGAGTATNEADRETDRRRQSTGTGNGQ
ncbi:MAG: hypothetical protein ABSB75_08615 [Candidatus Limnocylindrales bacterium]